MNDRWNEIFCKLKGCIDGNVLEKDYEKKICDCMWRLGWSEYKGEIKRQCPVQAGHETKYADIVLLKDGTEQFVIEVKQPAHELREEDEKQLFSYMRLLKNQVKFGLYIGDKIYLYYDDADSQQPPEQVFSVDIKKDNPDGIKFVELFSRDSFDVSALTGFCKERKRLSQERMQIQKEAAKICSDASGQVFKEALKKQYLSDGYSEEWINEVLGKIVLSVSPIEIVQTNKAVVKSSDCGSRLYGDSHKPNKKDNTTYDFLRYKNLSKRQLVLQIVNYYVKENPRTYAQYERELNNRPRSPKIVIQRYDELRKSGKTKNFFTKKEQLLEDSDGIKFAVASNIWNKDNIGSILSFAKSQGYDVVEYRDEE